MIHVVQHPHGVSPGFRVPAQIVQRTAYSVCASFVWPGDADARPRWFDLHTRKMRGLDGEQSVWLVEDGA